VILKGYLIKVDSFKKIILLLLSFISLIVIGLGLFYNLGFYVGIIIFLVILMFTGMFLLAFLFKSSL